MNGAKCLVFGGNGFIGINLIDSLIKKNCEVMLFDRSTHNARKYLNGQIICVDSDLQDKEKVKEAVLWADYVFYLASTSNVISSINDVYTDNLNVVYVLSILEEIRHSNVKRFVFASSGGAVYGEPQYLPMDEMHKTQPISPYGITKLSIENYLYFYKVKYGLDYVVCRYSNPYGRFQDPHSGVGAMNIFLYNHYCNEDIVIYGNADNIVRDYICINDMIEATLLLTGKAVLKHNVYNVGGGKGTSLSQIIDAISRHVGKDISVVIKDSKQENVSKVILDIGRITEETGWIPRVDIHTGVRMCDEWIRSYIQGIN